MKQLLFTILVLFCMPSIIGQETEKLATKKDSIVDSKYREDQFYASVTYNLLEKKPNNVSQSGFSSGFHIGFIRDMPINKRRNIAVGIGVGLSTNSYNQNILISEENNALNYELINSDVTFSKNKFTTYLIEMPIEFRWRTSTATAYEFWRIYTGIKLGYVVYNSSKFRGLPNDIKLSNIDNFNNFQYGLTLSAGYSNVNFHLYYALNSIFNDDTKLTDSGEIVDMTAFKIGLIFYIL